MSLGNVKRSIITLSIANLIIGMIEFIFNIYLNRLLGASGMGLLALVVPINCLFLSFMTEGLVVTVSKMSAKSLNSRNLSELASNIKISTIFSFLWSLVLCVLLIFSADFIATSFLGDASLKYAIYSTCPLMILMSISNITKGHFLGIQHITVPALINISEKLLRFPIMYFLFTYLLNKVNIPGVALVYLCYGIGEIQSVLLLAFYYKVVQKKLIRTLSGARISSSISSIRKVKTCLTSLISGAVPICLTQCSLEFFNAFSSVIVKARLTSAGYTQLEALELLGKYKGMVFPLMSYPMILVGAICSVVVPKIAVLYTSSNYDSCRHLTRKALISSLFIGFFAFALFYILGDDMCSFFYKRNDLGPMIFLSGICAPMLYSSVTSTSLVVSIGCENASFRNVLLQQLILLILLIILTGIPEINIYGYLLAILFSSCLLLIQNLLILKQHKSV